MKRVISFLFLLAIVVSCARVDPLIRSETIMSGLYNPSSLIVTNKEIYISNTLQQTIIRSRNDETKIIAGIQKVPGYNGDGLLAQQTRLSNPYGIFLDQSLYIADTWNQRVRRMDMSTTRVITIVGNGQCGLEGDGGLAENAQLCNPQGIYSLNGKLYIADTYNDRIRIVEDGTINTIGGSSKGFGGDGSNATLAMLDNPKSVFVVDRKDRHIIYIADSNNNRIRVINDSIISTIAGGDQAGYYGDGLDSKEALLCNPSCVYVRKEGDIFICDSCNNRIRRILINGTITSLPIVVEYPTSIQVMNESVYIVESLSGNVKKLTYYCQEGYLLGDDLNCEPICSCSKNGECVAPGVCQCDAGYGGEYCQYHICFGKIGKESCSSRGLCVDFNNCQCDHYYYSLDCSLTVCFGKNSTDYQVCNSHGKCVSYDQCQCSNGSYIGDQCQYPICGSFSASDPKACSSRGRCVNPSECQCDDGYTGSECQFPICYNLPSNSGMVCSSNGSCTSPDNCECNEGYSGSHCQFPSCYGINSTHDEQVCSGHGQCLKRDYCSCRDGQYTGDTCELPICNQRNASHPLVCSGNGLCVNPNQCECHDGYTGFDCQYPICYSIVSTNDQVCSGRGGCIAPNTCQCPSNFTGLQCETVLCNGRNDSDSMVCSGNGRCMNNNQSTWCTCTRDWKGGYVGEDCQYPTCMSIPSYNTEKVCEGRGECVAPNVCSCNSKYDGIFCEHPTCYGKSSGDNGACGGFLHGRCESPDLCICKRGNYTGLECEEPICFGITNKEATVCSSHGKCKDPNVCECREGYTGIQCEIPICFSVRADDNRVCSGRNGSCIDRDLCECNPGYQGAQCGDPVCWEYPSSSPLSCGGSLQGHCSAHNVCSCESGKYYGKACEHAFCFGIGATDINVCNRLGKCTKHDFCECEFGIVGSECKTTQTEIIASSVGAPLGLLIIIIVVISISFQTYLKIKARKKKKAELLLLNRIDRDCDSELKEPLITSNDPNNTIIEITDIDIMGRIGQGGHGTIIKGFIKSTKEPVAIKMLTEGDDTLYQEQILHEIGILKGLVHENIIGYKGCTKANGKYAPVMELMDGSLSSVIHSKSEISLKEKIRIILCVTEGLDYLHNRPTPIMHRDLKPGNILISKNLEKVKICDFGTSVRKISTNTNYIGTRTFMPPEILYPVDNERFMDGDQGLDEDEDNSELITEPLIDIPSNSCPEYDKKVDIFSLSIVMWELFFNTNAYKDTSIYETVSDAFNDKTRLKIHRSASLKTKDDNMSLMVGKKNFRPFIPISRDMKQWLRKNRSYEGKENEQILAEVSLEYISLMKECWQENPSTRPTTTQIKTRLEKMLKKLNQ